MDKIHCQFDGFSVTRAKKKHNYTKERTEKLLILGVTTQIVEIYVEVDDNVYVPIFA